jgi:predicted AAA+ superfamily ATPase
MHDFQFITTASELLDYVHKKTDKKRNNYVFIDEIQEIQNFEKAIRSLLAEGEYDIYCTGSNANLLSSEIATHLAGRYMEFEIFCLSYNEFLRFHKLENNHNSLVKYIKYGGLPFLIHLKLEDHIIYDYLNNIYKTILYKDIITRHSVRNTAFLERLVEYLADNTGSMVSAKKISDFLKSQKINISPNVVLNYLSYLSNAFFIFKVRRTDIKGKKIFEIGEKYYFEDIGLRHAIRGYRQSDISKILENIVFLHLKLSGYTIYTGNLKDKEIDFVCTRGNEKLYVQVAYQITDQKVHAREFGNLSMIRDNYPKIVVSMDEMMGEGDKGIKHLHIKKFLTEYR